MSKKIFVNNLKYALLAQVISTGFSMLMYILVPKIMDTQSYAYWQLYLLYTNYSGFFHLGLVDGIYLKNGGMDYEDLDVKLLGGQLRFMFGVHIIFATAFLAFYLMSSNEPSRKFVLFAVAIYIIFYCVQNFLGFVFQAVNKTKYYSIAVILEKGICLIFTTILLIFKVNDFRYYIFVAVMAMLVNAFFLVVKARNIVFSKAIPYKSILFESFSNIKIGIILMLSGIASTFVIGSGRMMIDYFWGIETFGKISFSISMVNIVLLFIRQVSMVLFPALRKMKDAEQKQVYISIINALSIFLPLVYMLYIPMKYILVWWLPQYEESIQYLCVLLPMCIFDCKMQLIFNTYYKVTRKEKKLLLVNVIGLFVSITVGLFAAAVLQNIMIVVCSLVVGIAIRSIISEIYFNKIFENNNYNSLIEIIIEIFFAVLFVITSTTCSELFMLLIITICYALYLTIWSEKRKQLSSFVVLLGKKNERK